MKIFIEKYRGIDIEFETDNGKFQCICTEDSAKESASFESVKKFIDDYKKTNQDFKPFYIITTPDSWKKEQKLKVVGVRKDGRFVAENKDGVKEQISDYSLNDYMIYNPDNDILFESLSALRDKEEQQRLENKSIRDEIISKMKVVTLKEYKNFNN